MPTHVSQSVRELKELGRNLYAAMRSDFEVNSNASALPLVRDVLQPYPRSYHD